MPRFDLPQRRSGFWGIVPVRAPGEGEEIVLLAEVPNVAGGRARTELARIPVAPRAHAKEVPTPFRAPEAPGHPLIAICMGTFDPDLALLEAQLDSLRAQTDRDWVCVISDDHSSPERYEAIKALIAGDQRFAVSRSPERIGFYRNFERVLTLAPPDAALIALCDQDDAWHPTKLARLRSALGDGALVYSDQRLVDSHGGVISETLWRDRANNHTSLASMLIANTITGAASLFTRRVAELALPFPDSPGIEFHDHWIGLVALAAGEVRYVDQPLYDYIQHDAAVLGKVGEPGEQNVFSKRPLPEEWKAAYFLGYMPGKVRARTLLLRCGAAMPRSKRRGLERYLAAESSLTDFAWLILRPLRALWGHNETLGTEWELARGVLWRWIAGALARLPGLPNRLLLDCRFPDPPHYEQRRLQRWRSRR
jgi:glycosyltransferase involved in cell wall biosynthesis